MNHIQLNCLVHSNGCRYLVCHQRRSRVCVRVWVFFRFAYSAYKHINACVDHTEPTRLVQRTLFQYSIFNVRSIHSQKPNVRSIVHISWKWFEYFYIASDRNFSSVYRSVHVTYILRTSLSGWCVLSIKFIRLHRYYQQMCCLHLIIIYFL